MYYEHGKKVESQKYKYVRMAVESYSKHMDLMSFKTTWVGKTVHLINKLV